MSTQATVIGSYDAVRRSRDAQDQRSRSADGEGDNLMKGRTFIPRMSAESRKLLIEAMQRAKKKRQERLAKKKGDSPEPPEDNKPFNVSPEIVNKTVSDFSAFIDKKGFRPKKKEDATGSNSTIDDQYDESYDGQSLEGYDYSKPEDKLIDTESIENYNANGGKIPRYKKRTIKYRR